MRFNDTTSARQGLIQLCETYLGLSDGYISGNTILFDIFCGLINNNYDLAIAWILEANSEWEWDDTNYTNIPIGTCDLEDGQSDYQLPAATSSGNLATLMRIEMVEVMNAAGDYEKIIPYDEAQLEDGMSFETQFNNSGMPQFYRKIANSVQLFPAPASGSATIGEDTNGLRITFQRTAEYFATTDTTKQPGFAAPFHKLLSILSSIDYGAPRGLGNQVRLDKDLETTKESMQNHYANRERDVRRRLKRKYSSGM